MGRIGKNRDDIIDKAILVMDKSGLSNFQLAGVAKEMKMKTPSLYNHFDGMNDLIREIQIKTNTMLFEKLSSESEGYEGKERFKKICFAYRDFHREHPGIYETLTLPINKNDKELKKITLKPVGLVTNILSTINMKEEFGVHMMRFIRSSIHGFVTLEAQENIVMQVDADESFSVIVDMLIDGIWRKSRSLK
jgi:AcrR family transcriptional regulator